MARSSKAQLRTRRMHCVILRVERLDDRAVPSASVSDTFTPVIMAGSPKGSPIDSPSNRVDPNTIESPFAGVGSILISTKRSTFIGTGTAIGPRHILTAAHVIDRNADGKFDVRDGTQGVYFVLNYGEDQSHRIAVSQFDIHPDFTGFNRPAINDDIAVLTLAEDLPDGVPIYPLATSELLTSTILTLVGYGRSGDGVRGYTTIANPTIKRFGENTVDGFYGQDDRDRPVTNEVFRFDFDGPKGDGRLGGPTLGNDIETQLGSGDSGGPSFVLTPEGGYVLVGVNSYVQGIAPRFGSMGGGMNVFSYLSFIESVLPDDPGRDVELIPMPIDLVPVIGPSIIPLPSKSGIGVGAKPVSAEFGIQNPDSNASVDDVAAWDDGDEESEERANAVTVSETTEISTLSNLVSDGSIDSLSMDSLVSIDLGLLAFVADGSLSVEE